MTTYRLTPAPHTLASPILISPIFASITLTSPFSCHLTPPRSPTLLPTGATLFGAYQFAAREQNTLKEATQEELRLTGGMSEREAAAWAEALSFHHQWMIVSREHAAALVALRKDILQVCVRVHLSQLPCLLDAWKSSHEC